MEIWKCVRTCSWVAAARKTANAHSQSSAHGITQNWSFLLRNSSQSAYFCVFCTELFMKTKISIQRTTRTDDSCNAPNTFSIHKTLHHRRRNRNLYERQKQILHIIMCLFYNNNNLFSFFFFVHTKCMFATTAALLALAQFLSDEKTSTCRQAKHKNVDVYINSKVCSSFSILPSVSERTAKMRLTSSKENSEHYDNTPFYSTVIELYVRRRCTHGSVLDSIQYLSCTKSTTYE